MNNIAEKILGGICAITILLTIVLPLFQLPGKAYTLGLFYASAFFLSIYYLKETGFSIYSLVIMLYAISFLGRVADAFSMISLPGVIALSIPAHVLFSILLFWTSNVLNKKIGSQSVYVSITALVLMVHVGIVLLGNDRWTALGTNLYYVLLGLVATIKIKREIDEALIPAEQKILNIVLLVIAAPISNLVISTLKNL